MHLPPQVNNRLIHFKKQLLLLAKQKIFTVVLLCQLFCISRNTFYKYLRREREGNLGYISSAPISHGRKKGEEVVAVVLAARERFPDYGKRRIARYLNSQGISLCANTVQSILKAHNKALPKPKRKKRCWCFLANVDMYIQHEDSKWTLGIQAADVVCNSIFRKYESGDERFYNIVRGRIKEEQQLFMQA